MEKNFIETECGGYFIENGAYKFKGDYTENGCCFKDYNAWKNNTGVIYIGEYQLSDYNEGECSYDDLWTRESWIAFVKDTIKDNYSDIPDIEELLACDDFISGLAYDCFEWCDWQDLSTMLYEFDYNDDWVLDNWEEYKANNM